MTKLNLESKSEYDPPVPVKPDATLPDEEYFALCVKLGVVLDMPTYPLHDVTRYLDAKFGHSSYGPTEKPNWVWVPLRHRDIITERSFNDTDQRIYTKPIPYPVLKTIESIQERWPEAKFFISDERYASDEKDPFLMFTVNEARTIHVVERWDEPKFR